MKDLWQRLGAKARVITLKGRTDREEHAKKAAEQVGLDIEFFYADRHPRGGEYGCFDSHQQVCRLALENGEKIAIVLEDDFEPVKDFTNLSENEVTKQVEYLALKEAIDLIQSKDNWEIMYLGVLPNIFQHSELVGKYCYKLKPWSSTHAMIVNEKYMKKIVSWTWREDIKDAYDARHRTCEEAYATHPIIFRQFDSPSDIRSSQTHAPNYIRDLPVHIAGWYAVNIGTGLPHFSMLLLIILFITYYISKMGWITVD